LADDDQKSAGATVAGEALKVIPEADKQSAGRSFGGAIANLGAIAQDITQWARLITGLPRGAVGLVARLAQRWRSLPEERRVLPPPKLLIEAATRYAVEDEDELKARYERLLASAMDSETSSKVHPAFVNMLTEMTGVEARLLDHFIVGGSFGSLETFIKALALPADPHRVLVSLRNLVRLALIAVQEGPPLKVTAAAPVFGSTQGPEEIHIGETIYLFLDENRNIDASKPFIETSAAYRLTPLGRDFLAVVGKRDAS
jgi:hypothetical protein